MTIAFFETVEIVMKCSVNSQSSSGNEVNVFIVSSWLILCPYFSFINAIIPDIPFCLNDWIKQLCPLFVQRGNHSALPCFLTLLCAAEYTFQVSAVLTQIYYSFESEWTQLLFMYEQLLFYLQQAHSRLQRQSCT